MAWLVWNFELELEYYWNSIFGNCNQGLSRFTRLYESRHVSDPLGSSYLHRVDEFVYCIFLRIFQFQMSPKLMIYYEVGFSAHTET